jgi:YD repeat-containing protein
MLKHHGCVVVSIGKERQYVGRWKQMHAYDVLGRVTSIKAPGNLNAIQYFYIANTCLSCGDESVKLDHIIMPEGNRIDFGYDSQGNLNLVKDGFNNTIVYTYDSKGNTLTEQIKDSSDSLQKSLSYSYDALNRLRRITNPDSSYTEYTYDFHWNRKSVRDPRANTTNYTYDLLDRLTSVNQPGSVDTVFGYNMNDNLTSVTDDNNNTTQYKYDDKGRVYQVISPDTGTTTYTYDPAGNLTSKTDVLRDNDHIPV